MSIYKARLKDFENIFTEDEIDMTFLRRFVSSGIPDCKKYRPICWKLLFNYLGNKQSLWPEQLEKQRRNYKQLIIEMVTPPGTNDVLDHALDHPLSDGPKSTWSTFFKDNETFLLQIDKDVRRLCPDISFFQEPTKFPCEIVVHSKGERRLHSRVAPSTLSSANVERKGLGVTKINLILKRAPENYTAMEEGKEAHWEVVERLLFIYAKLNPGQGYVQGMNEIIGPIYYVFAASDDAEFAEADCFWCFTALMSEIRDFFIKTLDNSECGIRGKMALLSTMLEKKDFDVFLRLKEQGIYPQYYSFRWLTLLLSQEFPLPDVLRLWDSILADDDRFDFLTNVCCAMIILIRDKILDQDFEHNVKVLQNFPPIDINVVLSKATQLKSS